MRSLLFSVSGAMLIAVSLFKNGTDGWQIYMAGMLNIIMAEMCSQNDKKPTPEPMRYLLNKIAQLLCLTVALTCTNVLQAQVIPDTPPPFTRETMGAPPATGTRAATTAPRGTIDIPNDYGISPMTDATLRDLGYTYTQSQTEFPRFTEWATKEGWSQNEVLDQYKITCALNDALWLNDTYMGWGPYMDRPNRISQSRSRIILPHGTYRESGTAVVALGIVEGQGSNVFGQAVATTSAPAGTTPGTMFVVDHVRWNRIRYPSRILMRTASYGVDFGMVGGIAYSEGTIVENIRFNGAWGGLAPDPSFYSAGFASGDLGEASTIRNCFASEFNGDGFASMNGTPAFFLACSAFNNTKMGFATLCTNGLNTTTYIGCSSDDNLEGKYGNRPWTTGSVCGGTYTIVGDKSETRTAGMVFGNFQGQSNITVTGAQMDVSSAPIDHWFKMDPKGKAWQLDVRGLQHGFNVNSLVLNVETGQRLSTPGPYQAFSFVVNNSGIWNATRNGIAWSGTVAPPSGAWTCGAWSTCTNGTQTRTCTCTGTCTTAKPAESQTCTVTPPASTMTATASVNNVAAELLKITDGNANTFWIAGASMAVGQWVQVDYGTTASRSSVSFDIANGYTNSYPRTFDVQVSTNGTTWTTAKAGAIGAYPTCTATFTAVSCRYVRVTVKTGNPNWLGVAAWR